MDEPASRIRIAIFASGKGTNAQRIIDYFRGHQNISVALICCNKEGAGILQIANHENIPVIHIEKEKFFRGNAYVDELRERKIDFIVLSGFLWKIPSSLIQSYPNRIINIHPALLPKYGGKGKYGSLVHEAVIAAGEKESGISIHFVDEVYDHGKIIFQATLPLSEQETPASLAEKIHRLEYAHFPRVVEEWIEMQKIVKRSL